MDFDQQIFSIKQKVQVLIKKHQLLQKENMQLKKELGKVKSTVEEKNHAIHLLQQKADALTLRTNELNAEEKSALEKRIDDYLKEIDKCIALLNAQ